MLKNYIRKYFDIINLLIEEYYFKTYLNDIGSIASDMTIINDEKNCTADPAMWEDWLDAIKYSLGTDSLPEDMTVEEGYKVAKRFFEFQAELRSSDDIKKFIEYLTFDRWLEALKSVNKI